MYYNLIVNMKDKKAVIRPALEGVTDLEFEIGCRLRAQTTSQYILEQMLQDDANNDIMEWDLYTQEEWNHTLTDEPAQPSHNLARRQQPRSTEMYNRGPYARSYR